MANLVRNPVPPADLSTSTSANAQPVSHRTIRTTFLDQNVELPLRLSETDIGVVLDRHGCDVFTVDVNTSAPTRRRCRSRSSSSSASTLGPASPRSISMPKLCPSAFTSKIRRSPRSISTRVTPKPRASSPPLAAASPPGAIRKVKIIKEARQ